MCPERTENPAMTTRRDGMRDRYCGLTHTMSCIGRG